MYSWCSATAGRSVVRGQGVVEVGAQCEQNGHGPVGRRRRSTVVDERRALGFVAAEREELLELVDDEQDTRAPADADSAGRTRCKRSQVGARSSMALAVAAAGAASCRRPARQSSRARAPREDEHPASGVDSPVGVASARADRRHDPGPDERALAAARCADDRQEPSRSRARHQLDRSAAAAEEQPCVRLVEVFEALEGGVAGSRWLVSGARACAAQGSRTAARRPPPGTSRLAGEHP